MENPFELLRLQPTAAAAEIVRHAGRLRQRNPDEADVAAVRQAVQALTGDTQERLLHELLSFANACYRWPAVEALASRWRRPPTPAAAPFQAKLDLSEFAALLRRLAAEQWQPVPLPLPMLDEIESAAEHTR